MQSATWRTKRVLLFLGLHSIPGLGENDGVPSLVVGAWEALSGPGAKLSSPEASCRVASPSFLPCVFNAFLTADFCPQRYHQEASFYLVFPESVLVCVYLNSTSNAPTSLYSYFKVHMRVCVCLCVCVHFLLHFLFHLDRGSPR